MILELFLLFNTARIDPLVLDDGLSKRAAERAEIIYKTEFSHKDFEKSFYRTDCSFAGEILAKGYSGRSDWIYNAFMNSSGHKSIIVSPKYKSVGIGTYKDITVGLFCNIKTPNMDYKYTLNYKK